MKDGTVSLYFAYREDKRGYPTSKQKFLELLSFTEAMLKLRIPLEVVIIFVFMISMIAFTMPIHIGGCLQPSGLDVCIP